MTSFKDWVVETSSTTGTGTYSLSGSPPAGTSYFTFRQRYSNGDDEVVYWVVNQDRTRWEKNRFGTLTYGTPDTLSRNVVESTNGDAPVSWTGGDGPLLIYVVPDAEAQEFAISMGLGAARPGVLKYGQWADEDGAAADFDQIKHFDGTSDDVVGVVNRTAHQATIYGLPPGYLYGCTLSRPSTTTITAAAGTVMDSTNVVGIRLASAMTKNTSGAWVAGSGNAGMGNSLTIANSTWYHVFAILVNGVADVYLDTSITAANKPAGTTHFRRIGSVKTNGSAQIIDFVQDGDEFFWVASTTDFNADPLTSPVALNVPPGINATWVGNGSIVNSAGLTFEIILLDAGQTSGGVTLKAGASGTATNVFVSAQIRVRTNTSQQVSTSVTGTAGGNVVLVGRGWVDKRGRN